MFFLRYAIVGLLPTPVVKHFELLSAATIILCQKKLKIEEIKTACEMLKKLSNQYEKIYGCGAVSMNLHLLNHYYDMILNCGPLWCYNLFPFENNIGTLKKFVCGNTDVLYQIAMKYSRSRKYDEAPLSTEEPNRFEAYQPVTITAKGEHLDILQSDGCILNSETLMVWFILFTEFFVVNVITDQIFYTGLASSQNKWNCFHKQMCQRNEINGLFCGA